MNMEMLKDSLDDGLLAFFERRNHIATAGPGQYFFILRIPDTADQLLLKGEFNNGREALSAFYGLSLLEDFRLKHSDYREDCLSISFSGK